MLDPLGERISTVSSRAEWAHQQLSALVTDIAALQQSLMQAQAQSQRVFAANRSLGERVKALNEELARMRAGFAEQQQLNRELHEIASQLADSHSNLEGELAAQRAETHHLRSTLAELEREAAATRGDQRLTEALAAERRQTERLREVIRELEAELDAARNKPEPAPPSPAASSTELMMLRAEVNEKRKKIAQLEERLAIAAQERVQKAPLAVQSHTLGPARPPSGITSAELVQLRATIKDLEEALNETEAEVERLRRAIAERDAALDAAEATVPQPSPSAPAADVVALQQTVDAQAREIQRLRAKLLAR